MVCAFSVCVCSNDAFAATSFPSEKNPFVSNYYIGSTDTDKPFFDEVLPEIQKNIKTNNKHSISPYYDAFPLANNPENFQGLGSTTYANINGKTVTAEAFYRVRNEGLCDPNNGMGLLIYQCIQYKRAHPEEDVKITFSSYRTSVTASVCVLPESKYYGYMRSLYGTNYDEHGFVRISYMLTEAARMGIEVTMVNQLNSYSVNQYNPSTEKLEKRGILNLTTYFNKALETKCYDKYAKGKKVSDYMNCANVGWTVNDKTGDMQHVKSASVSHYLATDGTEHTSAVYFGSANLDDNDYRGANGNNGSQSGVIVSDHDELYRVTYNYMQLMADYKGQDQMFKLRKIVKERNEKQVELIKNGKADKIASDEQIVYLGTKNDPVFELYFTPFGGASDAWETELNPFCKYIDKLPCSEGFVEFSWNEFGYGECNVGEEMETRLAQAYCNNPSPDNKISMRVTGFDTSKINKLKLGTEIGYRSIENGDNIHSKDMLMSYVEDGVRHRVSLLTSCNFYMVAFNYRTNSMLVINETDETGGNFYGVMGEKYSYGMLDSSLRTDTNNVKIGVGQKYTPKVNYTGEDDLNWSVASALKVTKQPTSVKVPNGVTAKVSVTASGSGLKYKWYFKNAKTSKFSVTNSFTGNTYSAKMNKTRNGRQVYCVITDKYGNTVKTDTVTIKMGSAATITKQPISVTVASGDTAKVTVGAEGYKLKYQWYYKDAGSSKYKLTKSFTGNSYSVAMNDSRNGRYVYCVVKGQTGKKVKSNVVVLKQSNQPVITMQPTSVKVPKGYDAKVTVNAEGNGLKYKWFYKDKGSSKFTSTSAFKGNTYAVEMTSARDGRQLYCVVSDKDGNNVKTDICTISMDDYAIAVVENGTIKALKPGKGTVEITDGKSKTTINLTVVKDKVCMDCDKVKQGMTYNIDEQYTLSKKLKTMPLTFEAVFTVNKSALTGTTTLFGSDGTFDPSLSFYLNKSGQPTVSIRDVAGYSNNKTYVFKEVNVATGKKVHMSIVMDFVEKKMHCYVNGKLTQTISGVAKVTPFVEKHLPVIGGDHLNGNATYFKGTIDYIALWSDMRTSKEISSDYSGGISYSDKNLLVAYNLVGCEPCRTKDKSANGNNLKRVVLWQNKDAVEDVPNYEYSFAVVGDTQTMCEDDPEAMEALYDWIIDNKEDHKIGYVIGLGDITDNSTDGEWEHAKRIIAKMNDKIPYVLSRGNHDDLDDFNNAFNNGYYENTVEGVMTEGDLTNSYRYFEIQGTDYLIMTLDFAPSSAVLQWADSVIEAHPNHKVIAITHAYMYRDGTTIDAGDCYPPTYYKGYTDAQNGDDMWEKCFSKHENVLMVLSGHDPWQSVVYRQDKGVNGNTVTQMLVDAQYVDRNIGSTGMVAMLYFSNDGETVTVRYYSVVKDCYGSEASQFTINLK